MFYLMMHSTHFVYGYMVSDIWLRTILIVRKETRCRHMAYSFRLAARVLLYLPSHRQNRTYHSLCYTSRGALAGTRNTDWGSGYDTMTLYKVFTSGGALVGTRNTDLGSGYDTMTLYKVFTSGGALVGTRNTDLGSG